MTLQSSWTFEICPAGAMRYTLNMQPVIPFSLNNEYNLITRTMVPYIYAEAPTRNRNDKSWLMRSLQAACGYTKFSPNANTVPQTRGDSSESALK